MRKLSTSRLLYHRGRASRFLHPPNHLWRGWVSYNCSGRAERIGQLIDIRLFGAKEAITHPKY
jgi:hypothetical protein